MKAAFYEKDITPPLGCFMSGGYCDRRASDVKEPLYVRSAVFENEGIVAAVIAVDACEFPREMHTAVCDRIKEYTGIEASNILISVTHTHRGISIYDNPEIDCYADSAYKDVVYRLIADSAILAYKRLYDATAYYGTGYADDISFNRNYLMDDGSYKTNCKYSEGAVKSLSDIDPEVSVLHFKSADGAPKGAIISFAVHQDCVSDIEYSGEFVYHLSKSLKEKYGDDFVTVFVPGTSADINHLDPNYKKMPADFYKFMAKRLYEESVKAIDNSEHIKDESINCEKELVSFPKREYDRDSVYKDVIKFSENNHPFAARNILYYYATNKSDEMQDYLQCIRLGDVYIYAYPGEIYVDYGFDLKKRSPSAKNIIATLANGDCGYIPTKEVFAPKSYLYEGMLCCHACAKPEAGEIMNDKLIEMANR